MPDVAYEIKLMMEDHLRSFGPGGDLAPLAAKVHAHALTRFQAALPATPIAAPDAPAPHIPNEAGEGPDDPK